MYVKLFGHIKQLRAKQNHVNENLPQEPEQKFA